MLVCLGFALALPLIFLLALYGYYVRARLVLGVWPYPYHPDPKSLGFVVHHVLVPLSAVQMLISPLALLGVIAFRPLTAHERSIVQRVGVAFATLYVLTIALVRADPGRVLEWFLD